MTTTRSLPVQYIQFNAGNWKVNQAQIVVEKPVSLTVNGKVWLDLLCTPAQLENLAVGFLFNEGLIKSAKEIGNIYVCPTMDNIDIWTHTSLVKPADWRKTSGCSGGQTSQNDNDILSPALAAIEILPEEVNELLQMFLAYQKTHLESRGVHTSALSDGKQILAFADDVGRHNTLDKLAGNCLLNEIPLPQPVIMTTGRISSEMLQKSAKMGCSVIISLTSPNNFSIELANKWGITLIGYTRHNSFNIYTHAERIMGSKTDLQA